MGAHYFDAASRKSAGAARVAARRLAADLNVTIEESFDGGWHEIRCTVAHGFTFDGIHELITANVGPETDGLWERVLVDLRNHVGHVVPCTVADCEWCADFVEASSGVQS